MKNLVAAFIAIIILTSCQEQQKIGFIDNGKVINDYQEKIDVEEKYKLKDEVFKKKTDSIGKAFQLEAQAFQLKAAKMSQKKQQEEYQALGQKQQLLQQQIQFEQQQIQQQFQTEIDSVIAKVKTFVKGYGKSNGYSYILGSNEAGSVMYGEEQSDLSKTIIEALNVEYSKE
ncbi:OmpH family outer membrane protein [Ichthyenterobacterium magnum]|uniref:Periplasmic chaperone for outer membrane proteins Skp n=1 Tax=Ichthyenterobacterium magnum TaxID=1230530 RepID=A0A420DX68_9FLAO|nr:OmpH family outer membrane protein [Ichthyenterobacterium magnum]RKE98806.1 periplasmic chaperone for outer membrane proteins Skp [Ichthyenterobacterium magnum]